MSTTMSTMKNTIAFNAEGLSPLSFEAFKSFDKTRKAYLAGEDFFRWDFDPCMAVALYEHFIHISPKDAERVKSIILAMDWLIEPTYGQVFYRKKGDINISVTVKRYGDHEELEPAEYGGAKVCFEVLRDLLLPMVYNW